MTLGEWLNQVIIEGDADDDIAEEPAPREHFLRPGARDIRLSERGTAERASERRSGDSELRRVAVALDALTARVEASEGRSTLAISGIDQHVMGVLARIDGVERDQVSIASRFETRVGEVMETQTKIAERLRKIGEEDGAKVEAMRALESALGKIAEKLYDTETKTRATLNEVREETANSARRMDRVEARIEAGPAADLVDVVVAKVAADVAGRMEQAETRTAAAMKALEASFAGLDARLQAGEAEEGPQRRFERLAADLSQKVEANRSELQERLAAAADGKLDRMESAMRELAGHVEQGERRSAQAIDRMGREVMRIAQTLTDRVSSVEARSADAAQQMGGEMARIADAMENRLAKADGQQAQALEKLGGEIARIAERLADRIASAERRSAQAIDEVGDQLGRATDRLNEGAAAANTALAERIHASEERTAKLLDEARESLDRRLAETHRRTTLQSAAEAVHQTEMEPLAEPAPQPARQFHSKTPFTLDPFGPMDRARDTADHASSGSAFEANEAAPFGRDAPPSPFSKIITPLPDAKPMFGAADESYSGFAADLPPETFDAPFLAAPSARPDLEPRSTRDVVASVRAAARQASEDGGSRTRRDALAGTGAAGGASVLAPPFEPEAAERPRFGFGLTKKKKKDAGVTLGTFVVASGTAAALAVAALGAIGVAASEGGFGGVTHFDHTPPASTGVAPTAAKADPTILASASAPEASASAAKDGTGVSTEPADVKPETLAVAIVPATGSTIGPKTAASTKAKIPTLPHVGPASPAASTAAEARPLYNTAVGRLQSGDASGVEDLRKAANLGFAPAQFYLAKLYEAGGSGIKKDLTEARRWTARAAEGGDARAMHNYALFQYAGDGGAQDLSGAATWFHKAAELGVVDSEYNLARLYAAGKGVPKNPAEAYKWYLIAAAQGDADSRTAADALKTELPPEAQTVAERSAAAFHAQTAGTVQTAAARP